MSQYNWYTKQYSIYLSLSCSTAPADSSEQAKRTFEPRFKSASKTDLQKKENEQSKPLQISLQPCETSWCSNYKAHRFSNTWHCYRFSNFLLKISKTCTQYCSASLHYAGLSHTDLLLYSGQFCVYNVQLNMLYSLDGTLHVTQGHSIQCSLVQCTDCWVMVNIKAH